MKRLFIIILVFVVITSCKKTDENKNTDLIGKWKMTEVLMDPGDGSGTFHSVGSNKTLEFFADGTITSNGSLCTNSIETNFPDTGTFSLSDSTITSTQCYDDLPLKIRFLHKGEVLTIWYPCIEPCGARFRKM